jgi:hypothetical protein
MKLRAASCAVSRVRNVSKQRELLIMQLLVLFFPALLLDVFANHLLVAVLAYRADVIALRPELAAPQLLSHLWTGHKDFSRRNALDDLHDLFRTVHRHRLHQEMHVVFVRADLQKRNLVAFADLLANLFELLVYFRAKYHAAVLGWTNDVVQQYRDVVTLVDEAAHSSSILFAASCGELTP